MVVNQSLLKAIHWRINKKIFILQILMLFKWDWKYFILSFSTNIGVIMRCRDNENFKTIDYMLRIIHSLFFKIVKKVSSWSDSEIDITRKQNYCNIITLSSFVWFTVSLVSSYFFFYKILCFSAWNLVQKILLAPILLDGGIFYVLLKVNSKKAQIEHFFQNF